MYVTTENQRFIFEHNKRNSSHKNYLTGLLYKFQKNCSEILKTDVTFEECKELYLNAIKPTHEPTHEATHEPTHREFYDPTWSTLYYYKAYRLKPKELKKLFNWATHTHTTADKPRLIHLL